ncbi:hypothetical protein AVEN_129492-1, partial [Araneus ventricosus]
MVKGTTTGSPVGQDIASVAAECVSYVNQMFLTAISLTSSYQ